MERCTLPLLLTLALTATSAGADNALHIGQRTLQFNNTTVTESVFRDAQEREVSLRGWNVSGSVKLLSKGFKPFLSKEDAATSFELMKRNTGANVVRFTLSWEGAHPAPDQIDYAYLDAVIAQLREAFRLQIYVFLDFHTDLYSRYLFSENSLYTGNGAPEWIIKGGHYPPSGCLPVMCFVWGQSIISDPPVILAYQNFFNNAAIQTAAGERHVQDEFLWQMQQVLQYIKKQLSTEEFAWITGVEPINEPSYGLVYNDQASAFDNDKLWPFYQRVRTILNQLGWQNKWVFAEPSVFWASNVGFFIPPTGGHLLKQKPGDGFVFAPHFYDQARIGITNFSRVSNGEYFADFDTIRNEARFLGLPVLVGEFGMSLKDQNGGSRDYARIVHGIYQSLESSDVNQTQKSRRPDFYTALISGTQWHWDIYKDNHQEYQNANPRLLKTAGDGWNSEDFSAIKGGDLAVNPNLVQRAFPRAVDGNIISFYYNDLARDGAGIRLDSAEIKAADNTRYFADKNFALLVWQGGNGSNSELFLPATFNAEYTSIITDSAIQIGKQGLFSLQAEFNSGVTGYRLLIPSTSKLSSGLNNENKTAIHFALVVNQADQSLAELQILQQQIKQQLQAQQNPLYLRGRMAGLNYPEEFGLNSDIQLIGSEKHFLFWRWVNLQWTAPQEVAVWQKDTLIRQAAKTGSGWFFSYVGAKDSFKVCNKSGTDCSRSITFD